MPLMSFTKGRDTMLISILVVLMRCSCYNRTEVCTETLAKGLMTYYLNHLNPGRVFFFFCRKLSDLLSIGNSGSARLTN